MEKESALPKNIRQIGDVRDEEKVYIENKSIENKGFFSKILGWFK